MSADNSGKCSTFPSSVPNTFRKSALLSAVVKSRHSEILDVVTFGILSPFLVVIASVVVSSVF